MFIVFPMIAFFFTVVAGIALDIPREEAVDVRPFRQWVCREALFAYGLTGRSGANLPTSIAIVVSV
jgi:hypothetical protein